MGTGTGAGGSRSAPLRVDAQRNLEHVLRAAREVFGELGYGAPMEDVARRARVGVGTVYRRFPSKDVLVRRIAEEETSRLTDQARTALGQEDEPWSALSRFLRTSVASGAGTAASAAGAAGRRRRRGGRRRHVAEGFGPTRAGRARRGAGAAAASGGRPSGAPAGAGSIEHADGARAELDDAGRGRAARRWSGSWWTGRGRRVSCARDVTVADVLLVIATAAPSLPDAAQQAAASARLLDILLEGLRSRPS